MSGDKKPSDNDATADPDGPPISVAATVPSTNTKPTNAPNNQQGDCNLQNPKRGGLDWRAITELLFTCVIMIATVVNVCVAARQWQAMLKSNSISREAYTTVQRAFVTVRKLDFISFKDAGGKITAWAYAPIIKNSGTTPTQNFEYVFGSAGFSNQGFENVTNVISDQKFDPERLFERGYKTKSIVGPQDTFDIAQPPEGIPNSAFGSINSGDVFQVVIGTIHYDDIFSNTPHHRTMYCFVIRTNRDQTGSIVPSAVRCPRWNCAGDECKEQEGEK